MFALLGHGDMTLHSVLIIKYDSKLNSLQTSTGLFFVKPCLSRIVSQSVFKNANI